MSYISQTRALRAAWIILAVAGFSTAARADIKDYTFQLVDAAVQVAPDAILTVRLINTVTNKPVEGAVIFTMRLDMAPDGMQQMTTKIIALPASDPGLYRFKADVNMAGGWQLSLGAKVQGEAGTLQGKLILKATQ